MHVEVVAAGVAANELRDDGDKGGEQNEQVDRKSCGFPGPQVRGTTGAPIFLAEPATL